MSPQTRRAIYGLGRYVKEQLSELGKQLSQLGGRLEDLEDEVAQKADKGAKGEPDWVTAERQHLENRIVTLEYRLDILTRASSESPETR